jgi:hypothetical protein
MMSAACAVLDVNASSGCSSTGKETMWKVIARCRRIVEILRDDREIGDCQRDRRSVQDQQNQRQYERQHECPPVSNDLDQLFPGLRDYTSHL